MIIPMRLPRTMMMTKKNCFGLSCCLSNGLSWLLILGCLNLFLTTKLTGIVTQNTSSTTITNAAVTNGTRNGTKEIAKQEKHLFSHLNLAQGHWDQSRNFRIFQHVITGSDYSQLSQLYDVTLVTQSSLDKLHWLSQVGTTWSGPISLALFVPDIEFDFAAKFLHHLINCDDTLRSKLAVHLIYPIDKPPRHVQMWNFNFNCSINAAKVLQTLYTDNELKKPEFTGWRTTYPYPQNLARNVARKGANTKFSFVLDIDVIPSADSARNLAKFLAINACPMCAFVIATYELDATAKFPGNKSELLQYVEQKKARPFHQVVFKLNQFATNFSQYERPQNDSSMHVSHPVTNYEFFYEPFYVSMDSAPPFDERFIGYGFTRNTQVYEMWVQGFSFQVLSPIFAIHWGYQKKKTRPQWRERQNNRNRLRFKLFKDEIWARYGKTPPSPKPTKKKS